MSSSCCCRNMAITVRRDDVNVLKCTVGQHVLWLGRVGAERRSDAAEGPNKAETRGAAAGEPAL